MKKFAIVCLTIAGIMMVLGIALCGLSWVLDGREAIKHVYGTEIKVKEAIDKVEDATWHIADGSKGGGQWISHTEQIPAEQIRELELELGMGEFVIEEKDEADQVLEFNIEGYGSCDYQVRENTLSITGFKGAASAHHHHNSNKVVIKLPKGFQFEEAELEIGAGILRVENLLAGKADLEVGAGELQIEAGTIRELDTQVDVGELNAKNMEVQDAEVYVGLGECIFEGSIAGNLEAQCNMGNLEMKLKGAEHEHDYVLECGMGNIYVGDESISGFSAEKKINNGAGNTFELNCDMGNIRIRFTE